MNEVAIFLSMIILHIIDDFNLQGILADFKQISWWKKNAPDRLYEYDWVISLLIHCLSWSIFIMIPIFIWFEFDIPFWCIPVIILNIIIHFIIDHLKANCHKINLIADQVAHFTQIFATFAIFLVLR